MDLHTVFVFATTLAQICPLAHSKHARRPLAMRAPFDDPISAKCPLGSPQRSSS